MNKKLEVRSILADGFEWYCPVLFVCTEDQWPAKYDDVCALVDRHLNEEFHPGGWDAARTVVFMIDISANLHPDCEIRVIDLRNHN